jgi:hypothetical protein
MYCHHQVRGEGRREGEGGADHAKCALGGGCVDNLWDDRDEDAEEINDCEEGGRAVTEGHVGGSDGPVGR